MKNINSVRNGDVIAFIDGTIFSREVVLKCLYWFGDKFHTNVEQQDGTTYCIVLKPLVSANLKEEDLEFYLQKLGRDMVDFHLREIVNMETKNIRDLLVAKAFSNGEFDESPPGDVSDLVGFDPLQLTTQ
jgi:His-Xaa-Ser system protein HxsD